MNPDDVAAELSLTQCLSLYETMSRIREFETAAGRLMSAGRLPGFVHLSLGQEAVAAGACAVLGRADLMTTTHRGHGHCLAKGASVRGMMGELFGRAEGYCGGRSGSMHMADPELGILGANAIVGAGLPIALGGALAVRTAGRGNVAVAFFGEGAVAEGLFHETLNLAALWKLPLILICENNQYAEMSHVSLHLANPNVFEYAAAYGIPAAQANGNDVFAVRSATATAVARARGGQGPTLLEFSTYRWHGHYEGDPQRYRNKAEVADWRERDPLKGFRARWLDAGQPVSVLDEVDGQQAADVAAVVALVDQSPQADPSQLLDYVYAHSEPDNFERGVSA